jgi:type II secretory pathway pseudopilin PulG
MQLSKPGDHSRGLRGMTLLEVLIACGILVVGLSSIASLLPAAGSRLSQAALEDRAGSLAANAHTEAFARNLVSLDLFVDRSKSIAFGRGMLTLPTLAAQQFAVPSPLINQRIDPQRGFLLEDELVYAPSTTNDTPGNDFPGGRRAFKEGLCWGATLVPEKFPAEAGGAAVLSVPVFRKEPTPQLIALQQIPDSGGLYRMETLDRNVLKRFLASCSSVLVPASNAAQGPRWCRITVSWEANGTGFIVFDDTNIAQFAGGQPRVIAFDTMVRIDRYTVALQ